MILVLSGLYMKSEHDRLLPHPCQFTSQPAIQRYMSATDWIDKLCPTVQLTQVKPSEDFSCQSNSQTVTNTITAFQNAMRMSAAEGPTLLSGVRHSLWIQRNGTALYQHTVTVQIIIIIIIMRIHRCRNTSVDMLSHLHTHTHTHTHTQSSQPVYCADVYRERRYQMLCEYNFSSWRWAC